jgi:thiol:disulfide interchange protein DsbD
MGLLLLGAAVFFAGTGLIALVLEQPWMGRQLHWWVVVLCCLAAAVWMVMRTFQITSRPGPRVVFTLLGVVVAVVPVLFALSLTRNAKTAYLAQAEARAAAEDGRVLTGVWMDWTPKLLERARATGKVVVVDFTADWCINCKALKATVLGLDPVKSELTTDDVVLLTVDLTSTAAPGWAYLESLGQSGIPLLVVYTPGKDAPWMSNAYTPALVLEALRQARAGAGAAR